MKTWVIENHLCRKCGGRILRCVSGSGFTGGGNPVFMCADCSSAVAAMGPQELCWCGFAHRRQNISPYMCVPYSVLKERPNLISAFRSCGCDPESGGDVGVMLVRDFMKDRE